jgi:hypothetical protein
MLSGALNWRRKQSKLARNLKVLYTSGQAVTDGMAALFVEKSAFLRKPYTVDELASVAGQSRQDEILGPSVID